MSITLHVVLAHRIKKLPKSVVKYSINTGDKAGRSTVINWQQTKGECNPVSEGGLIWRNMPIQSDHFIELYCWLKSVAEEICDRDILSAYPCRS